MSWSMVGRALNEETGGVWGRRIHGARHLLFLVVTTDLRSPRMRKKWSGEIERGLSANSMREAVRIQTRGCGLIQRYHQQRGQTSNCQAAEKSCQNKWYMLQTGLTGYLDLDGSASNALSLLSTPPTRSRNGRSGSNSVPLRLASLLCPPLPRRPAFRVRPLA